MATNFTHRSFKSTVCTQRSTPLSHRFGSFKLSIPSSFKPLLRDFKDNISVVTRDAPKIIKEAPVRLLDTFVDLVFEFVDQPQLPSQSNFAPVEETGEAVSLLAIQGSIPDDFPEGVYIRNGSNPLFGESQSAESMFGKTSSVWIEGEGMLHALYFNKEYRTTEHGDGGDWKIMYNNRYVETATFKLEKERNKPCFLPAVEGNPSAVISSFILNLLRYGMPNKIMSNTNIIEHAGKFYSIAENYVPQEIDIKTLETLGEWDVNGAWTRPFTSHPKAPGTGELVTMGADAQKPYFELGVISADGSKLIHKVDLKFNRSTLIHDIGVTRRYNVILDFPLIVDLNRVLRGGSLIKYEKEAYSRIGIMPRYGDADSVKWFPVETNCAFHLINCYEIDDEVVVMACRARESIIPGPDLGTNKLEWFSKGFKHVDFADDDEGKLFSRAYEWRLNMKTGELIREGYLTGTEFAVDFPMINPHFTGVENRFAYAQVVDSTASSEAGLAKYKGLAKLYLEERNVDEVYKGVENKSVEEVVKMEYHMFPKNTYCSGSAFVAKSESDDEDDGWIITFVHNEDTNQSQAYIVDAGQFSKVPMAKIPLPSRVPYGFHGYFASSG
ncbi:carotenoid 9,10(9',10')-cleavage dioxygenase 1-like isoform X2 [Henckelia pumila]|uniref:carotenoid 9,10(9',10')-cleavage dioxygenase 1-like isoform X2 n=1 Tax=Henckelia pumila TaxID=405737 RepID=UPI003C6E293D